MQSKSEILATVQKSCGHQLSLYIKLRHQQGEILTIAREVINDIVLVEPVSLAGVELPRTSFYIEEIEHVSMAKIFHNATLYAKLRDLRGNLKTLISKDTTPTPALQ